jgi:hypothetical protein
VWLPEIVTEKRHHAHWRPAEEDVKWTDGIVLFQAVTSNRK